MAKKNNNANANANIPEAVSFDFGFEVAAEPTFLQRHSGGGGGRTAAPLPDVSQIGFAAWKADWTRRANGTAAECRAAMVNGTEWPKSDAKYADRGSFLSRFAKPGSSVARGIGDGPIVLEEKGGNVRTIGYWTFRGIGEADPAVVEEAVAGKADAAAEDAEAKTRRVRAVKAEAYTVAVRLATAKGDIIAVADVPHGAFVLPSMIRKDSIAAAKPEAAK